MNIGRRIRVSTLAVLQFFSTYKDSYCTCEPSVRVCRASLSCRFSSLRKKTTYLEKELAYI